MYLYGIDLGTTNSAISFIENGISKAIKLNNNKMTMPSCVMWLGDNNWVVGEEAYNLRYQDNVCYSVKTLMGSDEKVTFKYNGEEKILTPTQVSAIILWGLTQKCLPLHKNIKAVTITVPADFSSKQREETLKAGKLAGLDVKSILNEPTSASMNYKTEIDETVIVYDLGGGTFDTSIVDIKQNNKNSKLNLKFNYLNLDLTDSNKNIETGTTYRVLSSEGNKHLGGDDIDKECLNLCLASKHKTIESLTKEEVEKVTLKIEQFKKQLTSEIHSGVSEVILNDGTSILINSHLLSKATNKIYNKTKVYMKKAMNEKSARSKIISKIILVGGSTKSHLIKQLLRDDFPNMKIEDCVSADLSVAIGASYKTLQDFGNDKSGLTIKDVCPYTIGVRVRDTLKDALMYKPIIKKNTALPCSNMYTAKVPFPQVTDVSIFIYTGDSIIIEENQFIREVKMQRKYGDENLYVNLELSIDTNGVLKFKAKNGANIVEEDLLSVNDAYIETKELSTYEKLGNRLERRLKELNVEMTSELNNHLNNYKLTGDKESRRFITEKLKTNEFKGGD